MPSPAERKDELAGWWPGAEGSDPTVVQPERRIGRKDGANRSKLSRAFRAGVSVDVVNAGEQLCPGDLVGDRFRWNKGALFEPNALEADPPCRDDDRPQPSGGGEDAGISELVLTGRRYEPREATHQSEWVKDHLGLTALKTRSQAIDAPRLGSSAHSFGLVAVCCTETDERSAAPAARRSKTASVFLRMGSSSHLENPRG
jgi:hypothetical protein